MNTTPRLILLSLALHCFTASPGLAARPEFDGLAEPDTGTKQLGFSFTEFSNWSFANNLSYVAVGYANGVEVLGSANLYTQYTGANALFNSPYPNYVSATTAFYNQASNGQAAYTNLSTGRVTLPGTIGWWLDNNYYESIAALSIAKSGVAAGSVTRWSHVIPNPDRAVYTASGTDSYTQMAGSGSVIHELLHAHGWGHFYSDDANDDQEETYPDPTPGTGDPVEGANGSWWGNFTSNNAPVRAGEGWIPQSKILNLGTPGTATYRISPYQVTNASASTTPYPMMIRIPRSRGGHYYIAFKQPSGFDANLLSIPGGAPYVQGVSIHHGYVESAYTEFNYYMKTMADGETWTAPSGDITITQVNRFDYQDGVAAPYDAAWIDLQITISNTGARAPGLRINGRDWQANPGTPGTAVTYPIRVYNRDHSAAGETFNLSAGAPAGWTTSFSPASLTLGAGQTATATLTVTSPAGAKKGDYPVKVTTTGSSNPAVHTASVTAWYQIDGAAPVFTPGFYGSKSIEAVMRTDNGAQSFGIAWLLPRDTGYINAYQIEKATSNSTMGAFASLGASLGYTNHHRTIAPADLTNGVRNYFRMKATDIAGNASYSNVLVYHYRSSIGTGSATRPPMLSLAAFPLSMPVSNTITTPVILTNHDAAGTTSPSTTFVVSIASAPAGWTTSLAGATLTVRAGEAGTVNLTATAPAGTVAGLYDVKLSVVDTLNRTNHAMPNVFVRMQVFNDATPPPAPVVTFTQQTHGVLLTWPAVTDSGSGLDRYQFADAQGTVLDCYDNQFYFLTGAYLPTWTIRALDKAGNISASAPVGPPVNPLAIPAGTYVRIQNVIGDAPATPNYALAGDVTFWWQTYDLYANVNCGTRTLTADNGNGNPQHYHGSISGTGNFTFYGGFYPGYYSSLTGSPANTLSGTWYLAYGQLHLAKPAGVDALSSSVVMGRGITPVYGDAELYWDANHQIKDTANFTTRSATPAAAGGNTCRLYLQGCSETLGALNMQAETEISLGTGTSALNFASSNTQPWGSGKALRITEWNGSQTGGGAEQIRFGTTSAALTAAQLNQIIFVTPNGAAANYYASILPTGELVPDPGSPAP